MQIKICRPDEKQTFHTWSYLVPNEIYVVEYTTNEHVSEHEKFRGCLCLKLDYKTLGLFINENGRYTMHVVQFALNSTWLFRPATPGTEITFIAN